VYLFEDCLFGLGNVFIYGLVVAVLQICPKIIFRRMAITDARSSKSEDPFQVVDKFLFDSCSTELGDDTFDVSMGTCVLPSDVSDNGWGVKVKMDKAGHDHSLLLFHRHCFGNIWWEFPFY
jgi:hypothetical protein